MKNKYILCFLILIMLVACTNKEEEKEDFKYILFATPLLEHPIWLRSKEGFLKACEEEGYECDWLGPTTIELNKMNEVIETGILQKADAIITQGVIDPELLEMARTAGIPVIFVDSDMEGSNRTAYFGKDFSEQAELLLSDIERRIGKEVHLNIAIQVAQESFDIATQQVEEIKKVFARHEGGFEIVAVTESKSDKVRAKKEWSSTFSEHQDINVAISLASESAESCYEIAENYNMREQMLIYGVDDLPPTLQLLKKGQIDGSIVTPFYDYGYETVAYLKEYFQSREHKENEVFAIEITLITPESVKIYERKLP